MTSRVNITFVLYVTQYGTAYLRKVVQENVKREGLRPLANRVGIPLGQLRGLLNGNTPYGHNLISIAAAFDLEFYIGPPRLKREHTELPEWTGLLVDTLERHLRRGLREGLREELTRLLREDYQNRTEQAVKMVAEDRPEGDYGERRVAK